jgi:U3 small nucleolar RNA-associated protein 19
LYALLDARILLVKYRVRFFQLADVFLSSGYLPAYLVAAFVKRLARLALFGPPHGAMVCMVLMYKLLQLHPSVRVLIHRPPKELPKDVLLIGQSATRFRDNSERLDDCIGFDSYRVEETDPSKSGAMQSSLWELRALKQHYLPAVSRMVEIFEGEFAYRFYRMQEYVETSFNSLFHTEIHKTVKSAPTEYRAIPGLFTGVSRLSMMTNKENAAAAAAATTATAKDMKPDSFSKLWKFSD